jgi:aryl-alcohol dehydrogenase-like predicted oxidoreductase
MEAIELGNTGLRSPQIGFGCSAMLGRSGKDESLRAMATAWDEGIRFFDTARAYGYGESEGLLGDFLRGRRQQAVISTKFGILAARPAWWKQVAKAAARKVLAAAPSTHALLQKRAASQFSHSQFTVAVLQRSIEESLRKLGTEYVDVLFLHAPPASVLEQDDLLEALDRLVETGKVRIAGISAHPSVVELALRRRTAPLRAVQFPCNIFELSAALGLVKLSTGGELLFANQPFGGRARVRQCRAMLESLAASRELDAGVRDKLVKVDDALLADVMLNTILRDTGIHMAIPTMMRAEHIRTNVRAISQSRFGSLEIAEIRRLLQLRASAAVAANQAVLK